ncbi:predicted protein [Plenodomus lingam JN3]|uniref:Predicted protein n=1 Tax=Leptosphaeria maculans (strain JN3 / isolate v23.1.3 / race Av1-4-5-6-7-8) TaxID=985895 RepID=E4ZWV9_LEPMJ|nr:predicted protein [Plenodomus lingam JN3]CBX96085.1 predicted protein [Plenodomus lingam JN3]
MCGEWNCPIAMGNTVVGLGDSLDMVLFFWSLVAWVCHYIDLLNCYYDRHSKMSGAG